MFCAGVTIGIVGTLAAQNTGLRGWIASVAGGSTPAVINSNAASGGPRSGSRTKSVAAAPAAKPRFEFYTMLPEMEVVVPEEELVQPTPTKIDAPPRKSATATGQVTPTAAKIQTANTGSYVLQVGSFRAAADAERLKANLALLGVAANVQTVQVNGADTWHRVRAGPYPALKALNDARSRLKSNKIDAIVLKVRR